MASVWRIQSAHVAYDATVGGTLLPTEVTFTHTQMWAIITDTDAWPAPGSTGPGSDLVLFPFEY